MAIGKLLFILSYLCVGIWGIFLLPFKNTALLSKDLEASKTPTALAQSRPSKWVYRLIILLGCVAFTIIPWHFVLLSLALSFFASRLCSPLYRHQMGFGVFLGLIMSSFIPWWMHNDPSFQLASAGYFFIFIQSNFWQKSPLPLGGFRSIWVLD